KVLRTLATKDSRLIAFSVDGREVFTTSAGEPPGFHIQAREVKTWKTIRTHKVNPPPGAVTLFSASGARLVMADDKTIKVWDTATGRLLKTLAGGKVPWWLLFPDLRVVLRYVKPADPNKAAALQFVDLPSGKALGTLNQPDQLLPMDVTASAFSP